MYEVAYNVLVLVGYVAFAYLSYWGVDKAWWAYVDGYLRKSKGKRIMTGVQRRSQGRLMPKKFIVRL